MADDLDLRKFAVENAVRATIYCTEINPDFLSKLTNFFYDFITSKASSEKPESESVL